MRATPLSLPLAAARRVVVAHPDLAALLLVLVLGAGLRLAFFPRAPVFIHGDTYQYYRPAIALVTGEAFDLPLKRPPLYPVFMALVAWGLGEDPRSLVAVQHLLGLGTATLTYAIGRLLFGRAAGLIAALVAALAGGLLVLEHYLLTEALFTFLLTLTVFLFLLGPRQGGLWWYAASGVVLGLATLTRVHAQILPLAALPIAILCYRRWCPPVRGTAVACLAAAAVLLPWMLRNQLVHGDFTVAARSGQSLIYRTLVHHPGQFVFYDRANPPVDQDDNLEQARKYIQRQDDLKARNPSADVLGLTIHAWLMKELGVSEAEANRLMRDVALDAIRARPLTYARLLLEDLGEIVSPTQATLADHWQAHEQTLRDRDNPPPRRLRAFLGPPTAEQEGGFGLTERLANLYQSPALGPLVPGLFLIGLLASALVPAWRAALVPALVVVLLHATSIAVVGFSERYRQPTEPIVHVVAIGGVLYLIRLGVGLVTRFRRPVAAAWLWKPGRLLAGWGGK